MIIIAALISLIIIIKNKKFSKIFGLIYVIILNVLITLVPYIMQNTESIWMVARSSYAFASLFGIIILYTCVNIENEEKAKKTILDNLHNGEIMLLHGNSKTNTNIFDSVIKEIKEKGYTIKSLDEFEK